MSVPTTAEQRLSSWPWRLGHSLWTLWAVLGFSLFAWIGFLYIGARATNRRWLAMAGVWFLVSVLVIALFPNTEVGQPAPGWIVAVVIGLWALSVLHALMTLPAWWRWRAERGGATWALPRAQPPQDHPATASASPSPPVAVPSPTPLHPPSAAVTPMAPAPSAVTVGEPSSPAGGRPQLLVGSVIPGLGVIDGQPEDCHGSFGTVYRVRRDFDGKHVAGKVFRPQAGIHGNREAERALRDEMAALESLLHPNIVRVMNPVWLGDHGAWMLVSEWVDGTTLETATLGIERMPDEHIYDVGRQLLNALVYLESVGVVHRDIKPTNVMLDRSGAVKLIDFNLTREVGRETAVAGTRPYLPPDYLMNGHAVDALVDRYAAGVLLYELLTAKHPYVEYEHAAVPILPNSMPADPRAFRPDLSQPLAEFLTRAVQPVETHRFVSAAQMLATWELATSGTTTPSSAGSRSGADAPTPVREAPGPT